MDDDFDLDLAGQYAGEPEQAPQQQPPPPPIPEPWTHADTLRLQKLQAGLAAVQGQVDDGTLHPEEGQQLTQAITAMMVPLALRQKRAKQQLMAEQAGDLMRQTAHMEAIDHANAAYRAQGFGDRVATYTDPLTGRTAHMVEARNGKWQEIKFDGDEQSQTADQGGGVSYFPPALAMAPNGDSLSGYYSYLDAMRQREQARQAGPQPAQGYDDPNNPNHQLQTDDAGNVGPYRFQLGDATMPGQEPRTEIGDAYGPVQAPGDAAASAAPAQQRIDPSPDGDGHVMTIQNGGRVEKWKFGADGTTTKVYDSAQARQQQQGGVKDWVQPHEVQTLTQRAAESLRQFMPQPSQFPNTAAGRVAYGNALAHWQNRVAQTATGWVNNLARSRQQQATQGAIAQRQGQHDDRMDQRQQEREQFTAERKARLNQDTADLRHHMAEVGKEPEFAGKSYADRLAEAKSRMQQERQALGVQQPAGGQPQQQQQADPRQQQLAELNAHLEQHVSGQNAPGAPPPNAKPAAPEVLNAQAAGPDTVQPLHAAVAKELGATSFWRFGRRATLRDMYGVLMKAQAEGRGPSVAERAEYERLARGIPDPDVQKRLLAPFGGK